MKNLKRNIYKGAFKAPFFLLLKSIHTNTVLLIFVWLNCIAYFECIYKPGVFSMKKIMLLILLASAILLYAQEKKLSIEDIVINSYSELKPKSLSKLKWMPEKSVYTYIEEDEDNFYLVQGSRSGKKEIVTGSKKINAELKEYDKQIIKSFPDYEWVTDNDFNFWLDNSYFRYNVSDGELGKLFELPESTSEINVAPNYKYAAYLDNENLFIQNDDEKIFQVTTDGARDYTYGQSVSRNEFGIKKGMFWSPNGKLLAFYKEDLREITDYPLLDTEPVPAKTHLIKYPMAGQNSSQVSIGIYDLLTEKIIWLKTEMQKDQYLTCVTWGPESRLIYVAHLNRDQNYMQLFKYDANTGERLNKILEERNDVFVEPENEMIFLPKDKNSFIWQSEKDGFNHLYLYSVDGEFKKQITKGQWEVTEVNGFDNSGELVFFTSTEESPLERHVYKQNIKLGDKMKLTIDQGTHKAKFHNNSYYFIDSFTNYDTPNQHRLINVKGEIESLIFDAPNPLSDYKSCEQKIFTLSAGDGTELYSRIIFPPDFDENKKYPAILYVYGGPHDQQITNSWQGGKYNLWFYRMAQEGYITFMLDNRESWGQLKLKIR
jgi:dipeptidyl-peptidase-4